MLSASSSLFCVSRACAEGLCRRRCSTASQTHVHRTRARVLRNTERLRKRDDGASAAGAKPQAQPDDDAVQDQGFTRPKARRQNPVATFQPGLLSLSSPLVREVYFRSPASFNRPAQALLLLPTRGLALRWVERMLRLLPEAQGRADAVTKRDRLEKEFGFPDEIDELDALRALKCDLRSRLFNSSRLSRWLFAVILWDSATQNLLLLCVAPRTSADAPPRCAYGRGKPTDFRAAFDGNRDDHFRLGLKVTRQSVRCASQRSWAFETH